MVRAGILLLFFGSGVTGLIYQVLWTKLLTLTFGVTTLAVSTVLASFFGGLALGSYIGGRWVDRFGNGFRWYGLAEMIIGLYALMFLNLLDLNNSVYVTIARSIDADFYTLSILKFLLSALLLAVPTILMGATFPVLSKTLANSNARFGKDIGNLYAVNTLGAVTGAVGAAFFLIPTLGIGTILYISGAANIAIGLTAVLIGRAVATEPAADVDVEPSGAEDNEPRQEDALPSYLYTVVVAAFALSGFTALAYEVIWTRILGFILTGTVYAFATVLATFLTGIAAGSFVVSRFLDRLGSTSTLVTLFAATEALIGISSIGLVRFYDMMPGFEFYARIDSTPVWGEFVYLNFFISFVSLIVPTFLFGATFPLVCKIYGSASSRVGTRIGNVYSVNTVGGIIGSFAGGFVLIPLVGMQTSIVILALMNIGAGLIIILLNPGARTKTGALLTGALVSGAVAAILVLPEDMPRSLHRSLLSGSEVMRFYAEGPTATVMIAERVGGTLKTSNKRLWVNGNRATAAYYEGLQINRFQGVLPMVLHPNPRDVLVICFGSGTTFGTLSQFDVNGVDNVEISKTVIKGAPYFKDANMDVLHNPKSNIIIDDGRSYLAVTGKKYDVITEEPMHPLLSGVVNLYTKEYYELAKAHLKPGGIMSQWIPLYNLSVEDVRMLARTFQSVFPHTTIWLVNTDIFLIGSPSKLRIDFDRLLRRLKMPNIKALLRDIDLEDPVEFLNTFLMHEDMVRRYTQGARIITDNMPLVEFTGPRSLNLNTIPPNIAELLKYREPVTAYLEPSPELLRDGFLERLEANYRAGRYNLIGRAYYSAGDFSGAVGYFRKALNIDPGNRNSIHYITKLRLYGRAF